MALIKDEELDLLLGVDLTDDDVLREEDEHQRQVLLEIIATPATRLEGN